MRPQGWHPHGCLDVETVIPTTIPFQMRGNSLLACWDMPTGQAAKRLRQVEHLLVVLSAQGLQDCTRTRPATQQSRQRLGNSR